MSGLDKTFRRAIVARTVSTLYDVIEKSVERHGIHVSVEVDGLYDDDSIVVNVQATIPGGATLNDSARIPMGATAAHIRALLSGAVDRVENRRQEVYRNKREAERGSDQVSQPVSADVVHC